MAQLLEKLSDLDEHESQERGAANVAENKSSLTPNMLSLRRQCHSLLLVGSNGSGKGKVSDKDGRRQEAWGIHEKSNPDRVIDIKDMRRSDYPRSLGAILSHILPIIV